MRRLAEYSVLHTFFCLTYDRFPLINLFLQVSALAPLPSSSLSTPPLFSFAAYPRPIRRPVRSSAAHGSHLCPCSRWRPRFRRTRRALCTRSGRRRCAPSPSHTRLGPDSHSCRPCPVPCNRSARGRGGLPPSQQPHRRRSAPFGPAVPSGCIPARSQPPARPGPRSLAGENRVGPVGGDPFLFSPCGAMLLWAAV